MSMAKHKLYANLLSTLMFTQYIFIVYPQNCRRKCTVCWLFACFLPFLIKFSSFILFKSSCYSFTRPQNVLAHCRAPFFFFFVFQMVLKHFNKSTQNLLYYVKINRFNTKIIFVCLFSLLFDFNEPHFFL